MPWIDRQPGIRPRQSVARRLDIAARVSFPAGLTVLLMLLTEAPLGLTGQSALQPAVALGCVWFWSIHRAHLMSPPVVFVIGLLLDLLAYLPFGVGTLMLLSCHGIAVVLRRVLLPRGFGVIWLTFIPVAAAAALLTWLLVMVLMVRFLSPAPVFLQAIITIALYPALAVALGVAERSVTNPDRM